MDSRTKSLERLNIAAVANVDDVGEYLDDNPFIAQAVNEIYAQHGDRVSVRAKAKSLLKFGRVSNADAGVKTTVATFQDAVVNETFATTNSVDSIISTSASDTGEVTIEGNSIDGSGNLTTVIQDATLNGQTAVPITPIARGNRIYVKEQTFASPAVDLVGNVSVYDSTAATGTTAGKPDVDASVKCMISAGKNQSEKCATAMAQDEYWLVVGVYAAITRTAPQNAKVDIDLEVKRLGGVWRPMGFELNLDQAGGHFTALGLGLYQIVPKNADVRMVAISDTNDTIVVGAVTGFIAEVQS